MSEKQLSLSEELTNAYDEVASSVDDNVSEEQAPELDDTTEQISEGQTGDEGAGEPVEVQAESETDTEPELEPVPAPESWPKDAKQRWNELPRDLQEVAAKVSREANADYTRKTQELARIRRRYEELDRVLGPHEKGFALQGVTTPQVIGQLLETRNWFQRDPLNAAKYIIQTLGVDPKQLMAQQGQNGEQPQQVADPRIQALTQEIQGLKKFINDQQQTATQQQVQAVESDLVSYSNETDESGQLKRPFLRVDDSNNPIYPEFLHEMEAQVRVVKNRNPGWSHRKILDEAYNRTERIDSTALAAREAREKAKLENKNRAKAQAAKQASGSVTGSPGTSIGKPEPAGSVRELLESAFASDRL